MPDGAPLDYVLGIDLGSNSLGWAMIRLVDGEPAGLIRAGVRVFEAGMEGDLESGQEESRNLKRRQMRLQRRQTWRRGRRLRKIFNLLQRFGLLPPGDASTAEKRQDLINELDKTIRASDWFKTKVACGKFPEPEQTLPYILRASALDERLEPHFFGRALYHLAQRRGFLSNRLRPAKAGEEDEGKVKGTIKALRGQMQQRGCSTLGQLLSQLSPTEKRIRGPEAWTARDMYESEFDLICEAQASHPPEALNEEHTAKLRDAVFHQRPLRFDPNVIGKCELEPDERRAPAYLLPAQRFRLLQTVNNLRLLPPGEIEKPLTPADRQKLTAALDVKRELKFSEIRKLLGLPRDYVFKGEAEGEKRVIGNRTSASFYEVLGERWLTMSSAERDRLIEIVHSLPRAEDLIPVLRADWGFDDDAAERLSDISLEPDYANLSRKAMERLLPRLEQGESFMEARKGEYPESFKASLPLPSLPPLASEEVERRVGTVRNPTVTRCLSELRRVINAIVRSYGKPTQVRIELARQIKKPKKQRQAISKRNQENEAARDRAKVRIKEITGDEHPSRDDIRRVQLSDDSCKQCVYCGESIAARNFLGRESQVDVDHIIPFSRSLDDSYMNLVICHSGCNRAKGDHTPHEAFSGNAELYSQILDRVKRLAGDRRTVAEKLRRFRMNQEELSSFLDDFRNRQLNDTAYAAKLATRYVSLLYGGIADAAHEQRVFAPSGQTTSYFRSLWKLNSVLNDGPTKDGGLVPKSRDDHRHHAVDAVVIGLTDPGMVKRLSDAAERAPSAGRRRFASLEGPWPNFTDSVRAEIEKIVVSHRVSKKVSGALHEETIYSRPMNATAASPSVGPTLGSAGVAPGFSPAGADPSPLSGQALKVGATVAAISDRRRRPKKNGGGDTAATIVHVRKSLANITRQEIKDIVEPSVRKLVQAKLGSLGNGDPKRLFSVEANLPCFETKDGRRIPIKRVRVSKAVPVFPIGGGRSVRHVASDSNHHVEIYARLDDRGNEVEWGGDVVTMYEAFQRVKAHRPIVEQDHGSLVNFKFSLAPGEVIECDGKGDGRGLFVMRKASQLSAGQLSIGFAPLRDARKAREIQESKAWLWANPDTLRQRNPRKVVISPLGEVNEAHD